MGEDVVRAVWEDVESAPIEPRLRAALRFARQLTEAPTELGPDDVAALVDAGVSRQGVIDVIDVVTTFNTITRIADALEFAIPSWKQFLLAAKVIRKRGYG